MVLSAMSLPAVIVGAEMASGGGDSISLASLNMEDGKQL